MIREKDLQELRTIQKIKNGRSITLQAIQDAMCQAAQQVDIPLTFHSDHVKAGALLNRSEDCLVLYHPEHQNDYFSIVVRVKRQGDYAFVSIDTAGISKLMKAEVIRKQINATAKEGINYRGYNPLENAAAGAAIVSAGIVGIRHLVKGRSDKEKLEIEQQWYSIVCDLLDRILS